MPRFESILQKYRDRTERMPSDLVESQVLSRIERGGGGAVHALIATRAFPPVAMAVGLAIGIALSAAAPVSASVSHPMPELAVFSPDAPHLPSTWLD